MVNKISIVISKNPDGYSVKFPELELIDHQDSSLEDVLNRLKEVLETHLIYAETTGESILKRKQILEIFVRK
jgi:predicted RNase H-like HicB family nuclease